MRLVIRRSALVELALAARRGAEPGQLALFGAQPVPVRAHVRTLPTGPVMVAPHVSMRPRGAPDDRPAEQVVLADEGGATVVASRYGRVGHVEAAEPFTWLAYYPGEGGGGGVQGGNMGGGTSTGQWRAVVPKREGAGLEALHVASTRGEALRMARAHRRGLLDDVDRVLLSDRFADWFGDWTAGEGSRVVTPRGDPAEQVGPLQPRTVYHGTAVGGFRAFDPAKDKGANIYGRGFYFTEDREIAESYMAKDAETAVYSATGFKYPDGTPIRTLTPEQVHVVLAAAGFRPQFTGAPPTGRWPWQPAEVLHVQHPIMQANGNNDPNTLYAAHKASDEQGNVDLPSFLRYYWNPDPEDIAADRGYGGIQARSGGHWSGASPSWTFGSWEEGAKPRGLRAALPADAQPVLPPAELFQVYLSIRRPLDMDAPAAPEEIADLAEYLRERSLARMANEVASSEAHAAKLEADGPPAHEPAPVPTWDDTPSGDVASSAFGGDLRVRQDGATFVVEASYVPGTFANRNNRLTADGWESGWSAKPRRFRSIAAAQAAAATAYAAAHEADQDQRADWHQHELERARLTVEHLRAGLEARKTGPVPYFGKQVVPYSGAPVHPGHAPADGSIAVEHGALHALKQHLVAENAGRMGHAWGGGQRQVLGALFVTPPSRLSWGDVQYLLSDGHSDTDAREAFTAWARARGYDGIRHTGGWNVGTKAHAVWIAFRPTQIKSVHATEFSPADADIYKAVRGRVLLRKAVQRGATEAGQLGMWGGRGELLVVHAHPRKVAGRVVPVRQHVRRGPPKPAEFDGAAYVAKLQKVAEAIEQDVENQGPAGYSGAPTRRRVSMAANKAESQAHQLRLAEVARGLARRALRGDLPIEARRVTTRAAIEDLLRWDKHPAEVWVERFHDNLGKPYILAEFDGAPQGVRDALREVLAWASAAAPPSDEERTRAVLPERLIAPLREVVRYAKDHRILIGWYIEETPARATRAQRAGLPTDAEWQAARRVVRELYAGTESRVSDRERRAAELDASTLLAKIPDYFPTPQPVIARMMELADVQPGMRALEPSAGRGDIVAALKAAGAEVDAAELHGSLRELLELRGHRVLETVDFLRLGTVMASSSAESDTRYDRIVMNPPFSGSQDIDHVRHAYELLAPGGRLVSVMSEGPWFRGDAKATAWREWLTEVGGDSEKLPGGSFASAARPTGVAARLVWIDKPG